MIAKSDKKSASKKAEFSKENVLAYAAEKGFVGWKFSPAKIFHFMQKNGYMLPTGKTTKSWKRCITSWWKDHQVAIEAHRTMQIEETRKANAEKNALKKAKRAEERKKRAEEQKRLWLEAHKGWFMAYTDGSCSYVDSHGPGGSAYVILQDGVPIHEAAVGKPYTTSNRMEMLAIISVLNYLPLHSKVVIYSDSQYAIKIFKGEWTAHVNQDLLRLFNEKVQRHDAVEIHWVKGHNGNEWNEYVDNLATTETEKILNLMAETAPDR